MQREGANMDIKAKVAGTALPPAAVQQQGASTTITKYFAFDTGTMMFREMAAPVRISGKD
mgnify:CR=1 FL=1